MTTPPKLTRIDGDWHFALAGAVYVVAKTARDWVVTPVAEPTETVTTARTRNDAVAQAAAKLDTPLPEPVVSDRNNGIAVTVEGWASVSLVKAGRGYWARNCGKCGGKGYIDAYSNIQGGICFDCVGEGTTGALWSVDEAKAAMVQAAQESRRSQERGLLDSLRRKSRLEAFTVAEPDIAAWMRDSESEFASSLWRAVANGKTLTDKQLAAGRKAAVQDAEWKAAKEIEDARKAMVAAVSRAAGAEGDKVDLMGTVTLHRTFETEDAYRYRSMVTKVVMLVDAGDGVTIKLYSTSEAAFEAEEGDMVRVRGTVKRTVTGDAGEVVTVLGRPRVSLAA